MPKDINVAFDALTAARRKHDKSWNYYDGQQPLRYATERLHELFGDINTRFVQNWCSIVVNAVYDRIVLERLVVNDRKDETDRLEELLRETELDLDADDITLAAITCGESYVIAWREGSEPVEAYYHDPRMCWVQYDPINPRKKLWGAKWWEEDEYIHITMYYPDRLEYWVSQKKAPDVKSGDDFKPAEDSKPNPYGEVPIFHFRKERRKILSELNDVWTIQDAINKLFADMMVSSEFGSFPQRYFVTNADMTDVLNAQNEHMIIPAGESESTEKTQVGQFEPAELDGFLKAIDDLASSAFIITRTPKHYFFRDSNGEMSGEALLTQEAPLNRKCRRYINRMGNTWQRLGAFLLKLDSGLEINPEEIEVVFASPESLQPRMQSEIRQLDRDTGFPLKTILRREGWSDDEFAQLEADKREEEASQTEYLGSALMRAQRRFNSGMTESQNATESQGG